MRINKKALLSTLGLYAAFVGAILLTDRLYTPRGANDITGPPFIVAVLGAMIIIFFFFRSIYQAIAKDKSYWAIALLHVLLMLFLVFKFMI